MWASQGTHQYYSLRSIPDKLPIKTLLLSFDCAKKVYAYKPYKPGQSRPGMILRPHFASSSYYSDYSDYVVVVVYAKQRKRPKKSMVNVDSS